jgi:ADP-heptose:LPS heptosyltransferase
MTKPTHILALRFSALGDIAMTVPVIKNVLHQNPDLQITFVSVPFVAPLFAGIERLHFYPLDIKKHKGVFALRRLSGQLKKEIPFDAVADLHDVLRTKLIRFFIGNKHTAVIDKGRKEKHALTRPHNKVLQNLRSMHERYADVFRKLGIDVTLRTEQGIAQQTADPSLLPFEKAGHHFIGIAPFAKHNAKLYPLSKMKEVIDLLLLNRRNKILLFGTKEEAAPFIENFSDENIVSMAGKLNLAQELNVISQLNVMVTMDSANMHLASLVNVPVVSIWGGTHPFAGFYGWGQDWDNIIQSDLSCRPSSVFGNKECPVHGGAGCMQEITPQMISEKVELVIQYN